MVTPEAELATLPSLLNFPEPKLKVYPVYTVIAEKFHAMVYLGLTNSRIKDFYDVLVIATRQQLNSRDLKAAIAATFSNRGTAVTKEPLLVFSTEYKQDKSKVIQWQSFLKKNNLQSTLSFKQLLEKIQQYLEPIYVQIAVSDVNDKQWNPKTWRWG